MFGLSKGCSEDLRVRDIGLWGFGVHSFKGSLNERDLQGSFKGFLKGIYRVPYRGLGL